MEISMKMYKSEDHLEIEKLEREIQELYTEIRRKFTLLTKLRKNDTPCKYSRGLTTLDITRYSRQIIMPQITSDGQNALKSAKVLIIGAGGLGCPAILYLAAAGIGTIHIMDYDEVELSNLHRQILHTEIDLGRPKVQSVADKILLLNNDCKVIPMKIHAQSDVMQEIFDNNFDVVLDCSDNVATRYLINDMCVLNKVPLVSGSALQMEGQLTVYGYLDGPCYRCLFPVPPPPETVTNCGDGGVLGPIAGTIGVLQALETIKIITKSDGVLSARLLLFDGTKSTFRTIKLRGKVDSCQVCGLKPVIQSPIDYEQFCNSKAHDKVIDIDILEQTENVEVTKLHHLLEENQFVLDVRPKIEYDMCHIEGTYNIPFDTIANRKALEYLEQLLESRGEAYTLCRRGNDSQRAVTILKGLLPNVRFINVNGGLRSYSKRVDTTFPLY